MKFHTLIMAAAIAVASCGNNPAGQRDLALSGTDAKVLESPDGNLSLRFALTNSGAPVYSLSYKGETVVKPSRLGFMLRGDRIRQEGDYESCTKNVYAPDRSLADGFRLTASDTCSHDGTWHPVLGEESSIREHYNELAVTLKQDGEDAPTMLVRFRLFDDGLGFRYEFPEQKKLTYFIISDELTEFAMAGDHTAWWIPGDYDTQEYSYTESRLSEIPSIMAKGVEYNASQTLLSVPGVQTALQMRTDDSLYVNIHEAAVVDYPTTSLAISGTTFKTALTPDAEGAMARLETPCKTPWRTVMVTDDARKTLASRLILNLNEPCKLDDVSWIHPTKYMGVWWEMITNKTHWSYTDDFPAVRLGESDYSKATQHGRHGANNDNVRRYIDFAAANGFDGLLIEGWNEGWEDWFGHQKDYVFDFVTPYPDFDLPALNAYAHSKGIRLIMHHETSSSTQNYERHIEDAYDLMNKYGYDAVKTGYVGDIIPYGEHHYSQPIINHYNRVIQTAARHHIMVNAHEAVRPTGLVRTWPNMIGNESARGTEFRSQVMPDHVTVLPFTRLQGGPMDFTPGIFNMELSRLDPQSHDFMQSTICRQLALYVTMYSPLQMAADLPEYYEEHMDAFQFIKDVAVDWEQSRYLLAEPGDYLVVARQAKKGNLDAASKGVASLADGMKGYVNGATAFCAGPEDVWFVGGVTDDNARELTFSLDFLKDGASYEATVYEDGPDTDGLVPYEGKGDASVAEKYVISKRMVSSSDVLSIHAARAGGFAISIKERP